MDLAPEEASCTQIKDHIDDLVERGADAHILLSIQPTGLVCICLWRLHHIDTLKGRDLIAQGQSWGGGEAALGPIQCLY